MDEQTDRNPPASTSEDDEQAVAEAREALLEAREMLLDERDHAAVRREVSNQQLRAELDRREKRLGELIDAADIRDRAAERRDRAAEARDDEALNAPGDRGDQRLDEKDRDHASVDRLWAAQNRDASAADRAELREMARSDRPDPEPED